METILIRGAATGDLPRLAELREEKFAILRQSDRRFRDGRSSSAAEWMTMAETWLNDARCQILVGEGDSLVTGYIIGWMQADLPVDYLHQTGLITEIALDMHRYQGGLGRTLVSALRDWFSEQGAQRTAVLTPHALAVEQAFWRSMGASQWIDFMWIT